MWDKIQFKCTLWIETKFGPNVRCELWSSREMKLSFQSTNRWLKHLSNQRILNSSSFMKTNEPNHLKITRFQSLLRQNLMYYVNWDKIQSKCALWAVVFSGFLFWKKKWTKLSQSNPLWDFWETKFSLKVHCALWSSREMKLSRQSI